MFTLLGGWMRDNRESPRGNPTPRALTGPDEILTRPIVPRSARGLVCVRPNPRKAKSALDECLSLYDGHEGLLVRTALIKSEKFSSQKPVPIGSSRDVERLCAHLRHSDTEFVVVLATNAAGNVIAIHEVAKGGTVGASFEPRHVVKIGLLTGATGLILVHNHPSGDPHPSAPDIEVTKAVQRALECSGMGLLDHVIIGSDVAYSFNDHGKL